MISSNDMLLHIFNSAKPSFFHDENRANLFEVDPESGMLLNTDNGTPMPQVSISMAIFSRNRISRASPGQG